MNWILDAEQDKDEELADVFHGDKLDPCDRRPRGRRRPELYGTRSCCSRSRAFFDTYPFGLAMLRLEPRRRAAASKILVEQVAVGGIFIQAHPGVSVSVQFG